MRNDRYAAHGETPCRAMRSAKLPSSGAGSKPTARTCSVNSRVTPSRTS